MDSLNGLVHSYDEISGKYELNVMELSKDILLPLPLRYRWVKPFNLYLHKYIFVIRKSIVDGTC